MASSEIKVPKQDFPRFTDGHVRGVPAEGITLDNDCYVFGIITAPSQAAAYVFVNGDRANWVDQGKTEIYFAALKKGTVITFRTNDRNIYRLSYKEML